MLNGLMGGAILSQPNAVVGHHVDHTSLEQMSQLCEALWWAEAMEETWACVGHRHIMAETDFTDSHARKHDSPWKGLTALMQSARLRKVIQQGVMPTLATDMLWQRVKIERMTHPGKG